MSDLPDDLIESIASTIGHPVSAGQWAAVAMAAADQAGLSLADQHKLLEMFRAMDLLHAASADRTRCPKTRWMNAVVRYSRCLMSSGHDGPCSF